MNIKREELIELYKNNTNKDLCTKLGISNPTLVSLLKDNDIPLKGKGGGDFMSKEKKITVTN